MYDVIIVGARCAGSALGLLLARQGVKVLMVDKASFPSDTISGHCVLHRGTVRLKKWGLLEDVLASNCPPITTIASNFGDFTLKAELPWIEGAPPALGPRRTVLDTILMEAAVAAGAEVRQGFVVQELTRDGEQITGIRGRDHSGHMVTERATLVVGADGKHSKIAQWVQAPMYNEVPSLTCWYMSYWSDFPCDAMELHWRHHRLVISMPTNDGLVMQAVAWTRAEFHEFRSDIEGNVYNSLAMMPDLADRLPNARRQSQFYGMADVPSFFRKPYGPGWALVGDAGHHKDPVPAYGISDAFCDAELLADAIHLGLSGDTPMEMALSQYEAQRNTRAIPDHEETTQRAHLEGWDAAPSGPLRSALRHNPEDTQHYFAMVAKALPREQFFAPDNIQRIMRRASEMAVA